MTRVGNSPKSCPGNPESEWGGGAFIGRFSPTEGSGNGFSEAKIMFDLACAHDALEYMLELNDPQFKSELSAG